MGLFEQLCSQNNLKQAYAFLIKEVEETTLPIDPIWTPALNAIKYLDDRFFAATEKVLLNEQYVPEKSGFLYAPKDNLGLRPIANLSIFDRLIYQAILNPSVLGNVIDKQLLSSCCGNRIGTEETYLRHYKSPWISFCEKQEKAFEDGYIWSVEIDIQTFFEAISIIKLVEILEKDFGIKNSRTLNLLERMLSNWTECPDLKLGIPQGPCASTVLANAYLHPLDSKMNHLLGSKDFIYNRYADDMVVMARDENSLREIIDVITHFIRHYNLKINEKTKLHRLNDVSGIEERKLYSSYDGHVNQTSFKKLELIRGEFPSLVEKVTSGIDLKRSEISSIKYLLTAIKNPGEKEIDLMIKLLPTKQSLTHQICRQLAIYLQVETMLGEPRFLFEKIWNLYKENSLSEWTRFWLLKLLASSNLASEHDGFQQEIGRLLREGPDTLRIVAIYFLCQQSAQIIAVNIDDIRRYSNNAKTNVEKAVYQYFLYKIRQFEDESVVDHEILQTLRSPSQDVQLMGYYLARVFDLSYKDFAEQAFSRALCDIPINNKPQDQLDAKDQMIVFEGRVTPEEFQKIFGLDQKKKTTRKNSKQNPNAVTGLPSGTRWEQIKLKFFETNEVEIYLNGDLLKKADHEEMWFQDNRKPSNKELDVIDCWKRMLIPMSIDPDCKYKRACSGQRDHDGKDLGSKEGKWVSDINWRLGKFFPDVAGKPVILHDDENFYICKMQLVPESTFIKDYEDSKNGIIETNFLGRG